MSRIPLDRAEQLRPVLAQPGRLETHIVDGLAVVRGTDGLTYELPPRLIEQLAALKHRGLLPADQLARPPDRTPSQEQITP